MGKRQAVFGLQSVFRDRDINCHSVEAFGCHLPTQGLTHSRELRNAWSEAEALNFHPVVLVAKGHRLAGG